MQDSTNNKKSRADVTVQNTLMRKILSPDSTPPISSDDENFSDHAEEVFQTRQEGINKPNETETFIVKSYKHNSYFKNVSKTKKTSKVIKKIIDTIHLEISKL